jgi:hypothetical protein
MVSSCVTWQDLYMMVHWQQQQWQQRQRELQPATTSGIDYSDGGVGDGGVLAAACMLVVLIVSIAGAYDRAAHSPDRGDPQQQWRQQQGPDVRCQIMSYCWLQQLLQSCHFAR